jgi:hypothetical protein
MTFLSCNNSTDKDKRDFKLLSLSKNSDLKLTDNKIVEAKSKEDRLKPSDCVRGTPEPVIKKNVFPKSNFTLQADSLTGIEKVEFDNGDKLTIENAGCEYFSLNFRFESSRFIADTTDTKYWADKALRLIKETEHGIDAPVDLKKGIKAFAKYIAKSKKPKLFEETDYGINEIRYFVFLNRIQKINNSKFAIELTFSVGPL